MGNLRNSSPHEGSKRCIRMENGLVLLRNFKLVSGDNNVVHVIVEDDVGRTRVTDRGSERKKKKYLNRVYLLSIEK